MANLQEHGRMIGLIECVVLIADEVKKQLAKRQKTWGEVGDSTTRYKEILDGRKTQVGEIFKKVKNNAAISQDAEFAKLLLRLFKSSLALFELLNMNGGSMREFMHPWGDYSGTYAIAIQDVEEYLKEWIEKA